MIVTTDYGRYRVEEQARGRFLVTPIEGRAAPGHRHNDAPFEVKSLTLKVGVAFQFGGDDVQKPDYPYSRIVSIEP